MFYTTSSMAEAPVNTTTTGGRFILKNHFDDIVTDNDYAGMFMLVYFGYTFCPDVCPTSLQTMSLALDMIGDDLEHVQPLFISIDPDRDTTLLLRDYVGSFHPKLIGLTGSKISLASITKKYRVKFAKVIEEGEDPEDYLMDHTASVFLMGPDGSYVARFPHNGTPEQMAEKIKFYIAKMKTK
jgi:protein SCO1/2